MNQINILFSDCCSKRFMTNNIFENFLGTVQFNTNEYKLNFFEQSFSYNFAVLPVVLSSYSNGSIETNVVHGNNSTFETL